MPVYGKLSVKFRVALQLPGRRRIKVSGIIDYWWCGIFRLCGTQVEAVIKKAG